MAPDRYAARMVARPSPTEPISSEPFSSGTGSVLPLIPPDAAPAPTRPRRAHGAFAIGTEVVAPGERRQLELPVTCLPTGSWLSLPLTVVCGSLPGPTVFLTAAIHGDELGGTVAVVDPHHAPPCAAST